MAYPPQSVTMTLTDDIDLSRGDMIARENNQPDSVQELDAQICWMGEQPLNPADALHRPTRHFRSQIHDPRSAVQDGHQHVAS